MERRFGLIEFTVFLFIFVFLVYQIFGAGLKTDADIVILLGAFRNDFATGGMFWLFLTNGFVHFDPVHLFMNTTSFLSFGKMVESFYSIKKVFIVFIFSVIGGNIFASILVPILTGNELFVSIGASGGISGLLGLLVAESLKNRRFGIGLPINTQYFYPSIALLVIVGFMPNVGIGGSIAHLGGFVTGALFSYIIKTHNDSISDTADDVRSRYLFNAAMSMFVISYILLFLNLFFEIVKI